MYPNPLDEHTQISINWHRHPQCPYSDALLVLLHEKIKKRDLAKIINGGGRFKSAIPRVPGTFPTWSFKRGQSFPHRRRCRTFAPEILTPSCGVEEKSRPEPSSFDARGSSFQSL
ncbi:hypothetical protein NC653_007674 [Populus alba x Populus x berolinensis]|uniref:Uncharacterized protein n=1 Tax=Populus alba x Populus x berolinensis TaxID=444605 RepID=A0AAD6RHW5_9ROSI|nr:hypothetical protein NC653_007674 [Populus alba x Populus x berolinensis]